LRYYEELGLLVPAVVDTASGYRSYRAAQLVRLHRIVALKELGLSLAQVAELVDDLGAEQLRAMLLTKRAELEARLGEDRDRLVDALAAAGVRPLGPLFFFYDEGPGTGLTPHTAVAVGDQPLPDDGVIVERTLPAVEVVSAIYRGVASHAVIGPVYSQLDQWAEDHGYRVLGPGRDHVIEGGTGEPDSPIVLELQLPVEAA
jgi:DNA-binding transcriptional MerR regulator